VIFAVKIYRKSGNDILYMISSIKSLLEKVIPRLRLQKPLGRWNIENCSKKLDTKVDLSNEDHCGPCGQYAITRRQIEPRDNIPEKK